MALAQEHAQAGEERGRWEKELAGSEVEAQVLQMDIDALTRRLQLTSASSAAMRQLRQKLSEEDRLARQGLAADAQHILNLPDVFFNGHVHAMKAEIQTLVHCLSEAQELKAEQDELGDGRLGADALDRGLLAGDAGGDDREAAGHALGRAGVCATVRGDGRVGLSHCGA